jgi:carbonic anhydrase
MERLLKGINRFKQEDFQNHKQLFSDLKRVHKPHTLFISCSDARVDPNLITKALPGELFFVRNIANIVPPYRHTNEYVATTSAIEYAVKALEVEDIVVCGHSNCGGCAACLFRNKSAAELEHTHRWLELIEPVREGVCCQIPQDQPEAREWMMEQSNVLYQMKNLLTYPYIRERVEAGTLRISGWYYIIETGEI